VSTDTTSALKLDYEGSVKRVWQPPDPQQLWFEFTDDYSVFDWGKMPDTIANKGRSLTVMGAWFFEQLADRMFWTALPEKSALKKLDDAFLAKLFSSQTFLELSHIGCKSHFQGVIDGNGERLSLADAARNSGSVFMAVQKAQVLRPEPQVVLNRSIFEYPERKDYASCRLVPLEVVFRFGMPAGSSLKERLERDPSYASTLGLNGVLSEGTFFDRPVIEFFTKLEPKDRLLSLQEAFLISGLQSQQLQVLAEKAQLMALGLYCLFSERGIELWDGKFEFIVNEAEILAADSIGPDELRLLYKGCHLSKELIRRIYRGTSWERAVKQTQNQSVRRGSLNWKDVCRYELKQEPRPFSVGAKSVVDKLYGSLTNHLTGQELFSNQVSLDRFVQLHAELLAEEGAEV
jgi:phosphoribosylaminoimidazole-succinocarboxamide synthase